MSNQFELVLVLLALAAAVTAIAKKINIPYPIVLVLVGVLLGVSDIGALEELKSFIVQDEVFHFAIIALFLPTLLGEATLKLPASHLREAQRPILLLAILGTLLSYVVVGFLAYYWLGLPLEVAFVFGALMAATDPVSVISIFKSMGVDHRLETIMEGESLLNDGVAVVLFKISQASLVAYISAGVGGLGLGLLEFAKVSLGGVLVGAVLAYLFSQLTRLYDDYPLEIIFSMLLFYGSFFIAEHFHVSGVIAVVIAGVIFGNYGTRIGMGEKTRIAIDSFWSVAALIANSVVFLMVGLEINRIELLANWQIILAAIGIVLIARSVSVYLPLLFHRRTSYRWQHVLNWGGLRGSLSIALALSLPQNFSGRETVLVLALGVVLFSLVVQGLTIKPLLRLLGVKKEEPVVSE
ncbi:cation:proton antiporter [Tumebacillus permanentifrigoris]|uniref:Sodium/proton antiporter (CPA1 family) n=1 Tax=Tumebacillus permanentifrigoris TaxID=378543 RepID=A0A316D4A3_9BACL|nr:sodium:proton antiporter [Tumebacillus permanentifrigoris]PWK05224.1 sodium/proton antiporter (CPA1 family) [Tumebacillus permanentifrigoris]